MSKLVVGVYSRMEDAEEAVGVLRHHGFPISQITVIAKDFSDNPETENIDDIKQKTGSLRNWFAENFGWMVSIIDGSVFQDHFHAGKFLLVAHGTEEDGAWADAIIRETQHIEAQHFSNE